MQSFVPASAARILRPNEAWLSSREKDHTIETSETRIRVRLTPRSARDQIIGWQGGVLRVRVTAPPVDGRANAALERLLAGALGVPKTAVRVVAGDRSRAKAVAIEGVSEAEVLSRLSV